MSRKKVKETAFHSVTTQAVPKERVSQKTSAKRKIVTPQRSKPRILPQSPSMRFNLEVNR